jgi:hypothetical protein
MKCDELFREIDPHMTIVSHPHHISYYINGLPQNKKVKKQLIDIMKCIRLAGFLRIQFISDGSIRVDFSN